MKYGLSSGKANLTRSTTTPKESDPATHPQKRRRTEDETSIPGSKQAEPEQPPHCPGDNSPLSLRNRKRPREDGQGFDPDATAVNRSQANPKMGDLGQPSPSDRTPSSPTSSEASSGAHAQNVHSTSHENGGPVLPHSEDSPQDVEKKPNLIKLAAVAAVSLWVGYLLGGAGMMGDEDKSSKN